MIRILIVDDHSVVRAGLRTILGREHGLQIVGEAADGSAALEAFRRLTPGLVVLDLQLPDQDGKTLIPRFLQENPKARILVLSTYATEADVTLSLSQGARGYLLKSDPSRELIAAVKGVARGDLHVSREAAAAIPYGEGLKPLTERELDIMRLVAQGTANEDIVRQLDISPHTLKTHFTHILAKLDVKDRTQALVAVVKRGLLRMS
ncbi:MAG: response regulator transcription factor [Acidobacteria bacterium]|nr:response regulator transcription factor [Acidobacteriota bacterium]